ncbi:MAG: alpha/beta hydrolase, partial [Deltaproteobacteria bacterium]|nr:alpha/beta hydrolase [Deltaproteobacteria bacterium]
AAAVTIPTLLVAGESDIIRPELFASLAAALPAARLLVLKGHDHVSYIVDQDLLLPYLLDFFPA